MERYKDIVWDSIKHPQKAHAILLDSIKANSTAIDPSGLDSARPSPLGSLLSLHIPALMTIKIYLRAVFLHSHLACLCLRAWTHRRKMIRNGKRPPLSSHLSSPLLAILWRRTPSACGLPFETPAAAVEHGSRACLCAFSFPHAAVWHVQTDKEFPRFCWQVRN